jgi:hypothetical protein
MKKDSQNNKNGVVRNGDFSDDDAEVNISRNMKESRRPLDQHKTREY